MSHISDALAFLAALEQNNNKEWMAQHKAWHKSAQAGFEQLTQHIITELSFEEPALAQLQAKDLIFRLNRDTRFSHDKSPYNAAFRAHIAPAGRLPIPVGYFISLAPGQSFIGGGLFAAMFTEATSMIRDYLLTHGDQLTAILEEPVFAQSYTLMGEKLKRVPRGYDADSPYGEYLKHKSWFIEYRLPDERLDDDQVFCQLIVEKCRLMKPFNDFLNHALADFKMPERPK